jgi:hypothetical protein
LDLELSRAFVFCLRASTSKLATDFFVKALPFGQGSLPKVAVDLYPGAKEKFRYSRSLPSVGAGGRIDAEKD